MLEATRFCPGKINWVLHVTRRRPDGYHELDSLFLPLRNLSDDLGWERVEQGGITLNCPKHPELSGADNLVCRAARLYAEAAHLATPNWHFELTKRIPLAAGLGGGSSDAAGALLLLNQHYKKFSAAELSELGRQIGADVPFFLQDYPALASGIGEILTPCPHVQIPPLVLVNPGFPVSAKWAYTHLDVSALHAPEHPASEAAAALSAGAFTPAAQLVANNLAQPLWRKFPYLKILRDELCQAGAQAVEISGSGPTLFAVAADTTAQHRIAETMRQYCATQHGVQIFEV